MSKSTELKKLVTKAAIRIVPIDALGVDPSYQREVKPGHRKIMADFDETAFGVPLVGEREDCTLWIVDGLQRITAVKKLGHEKVRVEVFASNGPEHEALVFKLVNLNRTRLRPIEEFRALLTSHDETCWMIRNVVEECGFRIGTGDGELSCVNTLRRIAVTGGQGIPAVRFTLNTVRAAWPADPLAIYSDLLLGFCVFFGSMDGVVDLDRLLPRLQTSTPQKILYAAKQRSLTDRVAGDVAEVITTLYRKRLAKPKGF